MDFPSKIQRTGSTEQLCKHIIIPYNIWNTFRDMGVISWSSHVLYEWLIDRYAGPHDVSAYVSPFWRVVGFDAVVL